jgi:hypothetical protein
MGVHLTEPNARRLVGVLSEFRGGANCGDLLQKFREITGLRHATFFDALKHAKAKGWIVSDGRIYVLDPAGSWKTPVPSIEEQLEHSKRQNDRLEFVAGSRLEQIDQLRDQLDDLRDWASGTNGVALGSLVRIVGDSSATVRQRLRAAGAVLAYKVDPDVSAFTKRFLESVCENVDVLVDYRIEAGELLRKIEGAPRIMASIERIDPAPVPDVDPEKEREEREAEFLRKKEHCNRLTDEIAREFGPQSRARQRAD